MVIELADDPRFARDISAGGIFVAGCTLAINSECALVVRGPEEEIELPARVVYVDPSKGAGLELMNFTPALRDHLTKLMADWASPTAPSTQAAPEQLDGVPDLPPDGPIDLGIEMDGLETVDMVSPYETPVRAYAPSRPEDEAPTEPAPGEPPEPTEDDEPDPVKRRNALNLHERLRGLTLAQQIKHASSSDPQERILLERFYGKNVWEALLRNPRLTPPEVSRIARMGTLPRVMIEIIVGNGAWLQVPEVRRALLSNPRLGTDQIIRVLRLLPKHELKLASTMTAYPYAVRDCAKRLLKEAGG